MHTRTRTRTHARARARARSQVREEGTLGIRMDRLEEKFWAWWGQFERTGAAGAAGELRDVLNSWRRKGLIERVDRHAAAAAGGGGGEEAEAYRFVAGRWE